MKQHILVTFLAILLGVTSIFFYYPIKNVPFYLTILVVIVFYFIILKVCKQFHVFRAFDKNKRLSLLIFFILFPLFLSVSSRSEQIHLLDNHIIVQLIVWLGTITAISFLLAAIILSTVPQNTTRNRLQVAPVKILLYATPIVAVSMFFLVAFYPAAMTPDSLAQWEQAKTLEFTNWHPVVFTWVIMGLTQIWDSPAIIALFQIGLLGLVSGFLGYILERFGFSKKIIWLVLIILALSPVNAIYSITIWKDVVYSSFLVMFSLMILLLVKTGGRETKKWLYLVGFFIISLGLVFFRHNGFPVFVVTMLVTIIMYRQYWKRLVPLSLLIILLHQIITGPVYEKLSVHPSDPQEALSIPTQQIAAVVTANGYLTKDQKDYINRLMPLDLWEEKYNPYSVDSIKFAWGDYDRFVIYNNPKQYAKVWGEMVMNNPGLAAEGLFKQTSLIWQMNEPIDGYTSKYVTNIYHNNEFGLKNRILIGKVTKLASSYMKTTEKVKEIIWRPAVYTSIAILFIYIAYLRNNWRAWLLLLPIALNTGSVFLAIPAQDFRYLYSNSLFAFIAIMASFIHFQPYKDRDDLDDTV